MKSLQLAYKLFRKHVFANILVVLITALMLYISTLAYNQYNAIYTEYDFFESTPLESAFLFMGRESVSDGDNELIDNHYLDKLIPLLQENTIVRNVSAICYFSSSTPDNTPSDVFIYDETTANMLKKGFVFSGNWPWDEPLLDPLPVIVKNGQGNLYVIGDILALNVYASSPFVSINRPVENKEITVQCKVVGIVSDVTPYPLSFATKTNSPTTVSNLLRPYVLPNTTTFFMPYSDAIFSKYRFANDTFIIYTKDSSSQDELNSLQASIQKFGYSLSGSDVLAATKNEADFQFHKNFFVFYTLVGLVLVSFFSVSFLNVKRLTKNMAIYGVLGATHRIRIWVYQIYFISMYLLSFMAFYLTITIQHIIMQTSSDSLSAFRSYLYDLDPRMAVLIGFLGLLFIIVFSWIPFVFFKDKSSIELLKER